MPDINPRLLVTGAGGQLGRLVVEELLKRVRPEEIAGLVRNEGAGQHLAAKGVVTRLGDYDRPETLDAALEGIAHMLLISSNALGVRVEQHRNVIEAARRAGSVRLIAYTSVLHADTSPLGLAEEHRQTEALLRDAGIPFVVLRNGWYAENFTAGLPAILAHGAVLGSAGEGRISAASRADYAAAAAAVLTAASPRDAQVLELAGDNGFTMAELAAEISRQVGRSIAYTDLPEADYKAALLGAGLPAPLAELVSESSAATTTGTLFDDGRTLSHLIGRPTTPIAASVAEALATRKG